MQALSLLYPTFDKSWFYQMLWFVVNWQRFVNEVIFGYFTTMRINRCIHSNENGHFRSFPVIGGHLRSTKAYRIVWGVWIIEMLWAEDFREDDFLLELKDWTDKDCLCEQISVKAWSDSDDFSKLPKSRSFKISWSILARRRSSSFIWFFLNSRILLRHNSWRHHQRSKN